MRFIPFAIVSLFVVSGCWGEPIPVQEKGLLSEARLGFQPKRRPICVGADPGADPPPEIFRKITLYESPAGKLAAYLSQVPDDGEKRPAIIWITGGDCNSIDDLWSEAAGGQRPDRGRVPQGGHRDDVSVAARRKRQPRRQGRISGRGGRYLGGGESPRP